MRYYLSTGAAALVTALALLLVTAGAASAGVGISGSMALPSATAAGQQDAAGTFTVRNTNTAPQQADSNTVTQMRLALSCGAAETIADVCPQPDTGVFALSPTATGAAGTACAGSTFTVSAPDADGVVTFTRQGGPPVLAPPGGAAGTDTCTVNFTFDVLKVPTIDADPPTAGVQTRANLLVTAQSSPSGLIVNIRPSLLTTVVRASPTLTTDASDGVVGQGIHDTATVASGVPGAATGTVTFTLYGPSDPTCSASPVFTSPNRPLSGGSATSADYIAPTAGSYRWRASYSGDSNHNAVANTPCNAPGETSVVDVAPSGTMTSASTKGDFNGDGIGDLAVGTAGEDVGTRADAGVVQVLYGTATGVSATGSQLWSQDSAGIVDTAEAGDRFGAALSAGDFNGDGRDDLAIGAPGEDLSGGLNAGVVHVLYGSAAGLAAAGSQQWSQDSAGIADNVENGDGFGSALASGKLNTDAFVDLVIGVPREPYSTIAAAGAVHVLPGSAAGVTGAGSQLWTQNSGAIADGAETGDAFGASLAVGDMNSAAGQDLAIGAPGEDIGAVADAGVVHVLYGSASGPTATGSQLWSQDTAGIADNTEAGDSFGSALAVGKLDNDAFGDLVVGVPNEPYGPIAGAGAVHVIRGSASGLTATSSQLWTQNTAGIADTAETGDGFGAALATGDLNNTAGQDLAIGAPGEDVGAVVDGGVVHVLYGSASGATATGSQLWTQNTAGIADTVETGDGFGSALAVGRLNNDVFGDLVVGVPFESVGAVAGAGAAHVIHGTAGGLSASGSQLWTQNSAGIADSAETGDGFGAALGA